MGLPAYADFEPYEISLEEFRKVWLPGLKRDGFNVGVNWSGKQATGYDVAPEQLLARLDYETTKAEGLSSQVAPKVGT